MPRRSIAPPFGPVEATLDSSSSSRLWVTHALRTGLATLALTMPALAEQSASQGLSPVAELLAQPRAELLILGTFHFKDSGRDSYKPQHSFDVFSEHGQQQVGEVVQLLADFAPTKVAVEWPKEIQERVDDLYGQYRAGKKKLGANEVYQLGFRVASARQHERVHLIDVQGRRYQPPIDRDAVAKAYGDEAKNLLATPWEQRYHRFHQREDRLKVEHSLRDHLIYLNREDRLLASHGEYLVGAFKLARNDDYPGADFVSGFWYNRNLRIFANVMRLVESPSERILLIIGSGHVPILRHAAQASPEVELIEVAEVLGRRTLETGR